MRHHPSRREFLRRGLHCGLSCGGAHILSGCGSGALPTVPIVEAPDSPTGDIARVAAIRGTNLYAMTREALEAVGGASAIVNPDETVFIKPNYCTAGLVDHNSIVTGDSTKPEIVMTVAEECLKAGAAEVIIGDGAQVQRFSWEELTTLDGTTNLAIEAERLTATYPGRVTLACLNSESPAWDPLPSPYSGYGELYVSSLVARADKIISIPVIKTHRWTQMTGSMKNFVGITSVDDYGSGMQWRTKLHDAPGGIDQCFLDIVAALKPDLAIIDCSICCEGNGPHVMPGWWGSTVDMKDRLGDWLMLVSTDLAAADATATRVISHDVDQVVHLDKAYRQGLGQVREDMIELDGARLDELYVDWQPADQTEGFGDVIIPGLMLLLGG